MQSSVGNILNDWLKDSSHNESTEYNKFSVFTVGDDVGKLTTVTVSLLWATDDWGGGGGEAETPMGQGMSSREMGGESKEEWVGEDKPLRWTMKGLIVHCKHTVCTKHRE